MGKGGSVPVLMGRREATTRGARGQPMSSALVRQDEQTGLYTGPKGPCSKWSSALAKKDAAQAFQVQAPLRRS